VFHFTKSFHLFATDYGMQEGSGLPDLHEGVVPTVAVDDASLYAYRCYPTYTAWVTDAATAAVYSLCGIEAGTYPIELLGISAGDGASDMYWFFAETNPITANAAVITTVTGLSRSGATTAILRTGTTTLNYAALGAWWGMDDSQAGVQPNNNPFGGQQGMILRPGEGVYFAVAIVNSASHGHFFYRELTFGLPVLPPRL